MFSTKIEVRYGETDRMGVVYHSRYFPWFEIAREKLMESYGIKYADLEKQGVMLPLVDCYCKFKKGAKYGDTVIVSAKIEKLGAATCRFVYSAVREGDNTLLAEGYTSHGFVNNDFVPVNMKKAYPEVYAILEKVRGDNY